MFCEGGGGIWVCQWDDNSWMIGCVLHIGFCFIIFIASWIRWWIKMYFFSFFWSLIREYPPKSCVFQVSTTICSVSIDIWIT